MTEAECAMGLARLVEYMKHSDLTREQILEYYRPLARTAPDDFNAAMDDLIGTFKPQYGHPFPLVPDIKEAVNTAIERRVRKATTNFHCEQCWGFGAYIADDGGQGQETFCTCPVGQKRRENRREYLDREGQGFRAPTDFRYHPARKPEERLPYKDPPDLENVGQVVNHVEKGMESQFNMDAGEEAWNEMLRKAKGNLASEPQGPPGPEEDVPF